MPVCMYTALVDILNVLSGHVLNSYFGFPPCYFCAYTFTWFNRCLIWKQQENRLHSDHMCCPEAAAACAAAASLARSCAAFSRALHMFMFLAICGSLCSFFHFIRLFWNHILICRSVKFNACAISILLLLVRYLLKWNSFSNSSVWCLVYDVLDRFDSPSLLSEIEQIMITHVTQFKCFLFSFINFPIMRTIPLAFSRSSPRPTPSVLPVCFYEKTYSQMFNWFV